MIKLQRIDYKKQSQGVLIAIAAATCSLSAYAALIIGSLALKPFLDWYQSATFLYSNIGFISIAPMVPICGVITLIVYLQYKGIEIWCDWYEKEKC